MRFSKRQFVLLLLFSFIALISISVAQSAQEKDAYVVSGFKVEDIPGDDGTGLMLSWKPLPKEKRIIEYRIYRGICPDSLFFIASIPVNVKTGIAADKMFYYDSSWTDFVDTPNPGKLKKEKQQGLSSPLYRKVPRDIEIIGKLSRKLSILAMIDKKNLYYRTQKSFSADKEDSTVYAGLKLKHAAWYGQLMPNEKYYYTVVAVDEKFTFHEHAKITEGLTKPNPPDKAAAFYAVYVPDKKKLQFEWDYPLFSDDLAMYQILMFPSIDDSTWAKNRYKPDLGGLKPVEIEQGSINQIIGSDGQKNYTIVDATKLLKQGVTEEQLKTGKYVIDFMDYDHTETYSDLSTARVIFSQNLPPKPLFRVEDKPNDKGDRLTVVWDNPIVFVTKTTAANQTNTKIRVNYQLNTIETQKVSNIYFDFYKVGEDKPFTTINEFYPDNTVVLKVPTGYDYHKGFKVRITLKGKPEIEKGYYLEQNLVWNNQMLALMPDGNLKRNGKDVSLYSNTVYRKRTYLPYFTMVKRISSFDNSLDITIPFESSIFKIVNGINVVKGNDLITYAGGKEYKRKLKPTDPKHSLMLVESVIDIAYDQDNNQQVKTSIYADEAVKDAKLKLDKTKKDLAKFKADKAAMEKSSADPQVQAQLAQLTKKIESAQNTINVLEKNPYLLKANSIKNDHSRMRYIASIREVDRRKASFQVVKSDGKGAFIEADLEQTKPDSYIYHYPISNWFDKNKFATLFATIIFGLMVYIYIKLAKRGKELYLRPIAGLHELDNAIGRATEMGRPILYSMGSGDLSSVSIIASLGILNSVAKKAAEYDTKLIVPCFDYMVMPVAQEIVREAHYEAGRPDTYDKNNVFFLTYAQFAYVAGFNGIMIRERASTVFYMGYFNAESLLMTETGNSIGAIQIAGVDSTTQVPFFITTCDFTLIGEELYAASAYLRNEPMFLGTLKAQDYYKFIIATFILIGAVLSTFQITTLNNIFPVK